MFDYSVLDNVMREDARNRKQSFVGMSVTAEVYVNNDLNGTKTIDGVCVDVYAETSFFDATVYSIKENETGKVYASPAYYNRDWHYPELKDWSIGEYDWNHKKILSGFLFDVSGCHYISSEYIANQREVKNGLAIMLENGNTYFCRKAA